MALVNQADLRNDIKKYMTGYAQMYCTKGMKNITKMAHYAMREFYKDYKPEYYNRTYNLYDPKKNDESNGSIVPYYHDNGKRIYGGVRITSKNMKPYQSGTRWETDPFEVASFAWNGYHGHPLRGITMEKSPLEMVKKMMRDKRFLSAIDKAAAKYARSLGYKTFDF